MRHKLQACASQVKKNQKEKEKERKTERERERKKSEKKIRSRAVSHSDFCTQGRDRTGMRVNSLVFETSASTNSATWALL